ncbi:NUDIX hydrolase [Dactylosporangium sp. NPDC000555]|uniref:NUDIX hydrolase n=1 Tax=Dactylosporangium sp. NPDC000555 TaxID=3154260 RepID=UPI00332DBE1A
MREVVRRAARAIPIDRHGQLLLIRRTKPGLGPYWTTPGGGVEPGDASVEQAMIRELREEFGAEVDTVQQMCRRSRTRRSLGVSPRTAAINIRFSYAHLLDDPVGTVERVLIYPGEGTIRSWHRGRDGASTPVRLATVRIPFPQPAEARTATAWETYLERAAERFREAVAPLSALP